MGDALPAWKVFGSLRQQLELGRLQASAAAVMLDITQNVDVFDGMRYKALAKVERQFPDVGGRDLYYGGNAYSNKGGLGVQIPSAADNGDVKAGSVEMPAGISANGSELVVIPTTSLYNRQRNFRPSLLVEPRILAPYAVINSADAEAKGIRQGDVIQVAVAGVSVNVRANVSDEMSQGALALPRHLTDAATPMVITTGTVNKVSEAVASGD
jgi:NADH-quinone oxidoreductase subunit G